jgi:urease accessory protein
MLTLTQRFAADVSVTVQVTLALTAEDRTRSRHYFQLEPEQGIYLQLPRGTVLHHGDLLRSEQQNCWVRVVAKPEPVMVVTASTPLQLLRAAYHLGNRHIPLEVTAEYLRLSPDPVLKAMLEQMGMQVTEAVLPFEPEMGAYGHHPSHSAEDSTNHRPDSVEMQTENSHQHSSHYHP